MTCGEEEKAHLNSAYRNGTAGIDGNKQRKFGENASRPQFSLRRAPISTTSRLHRDKRSKNKGEREMGKTRGEDGAEKEKRSSDGRFLRLFRPESKCFDCVRARSACSEAAEHTNS
jgi:hypothetical protein